MFPRFRRPGLRKSTVLPTGSGYSRLEPRQLMASFSGTAGDDTVTIQFTAGLPTSIDINGTLQANPDPTLQISLGDGNDRLILAGGSFSVTGASTVRGTGPGGEALFHGTGKVFNQVDYDFDGRLTLQTGDGNDQFNIQAVPGFLPGTSVANPSFSLDTGSGNDTVTTSGGLGFIRLGAGLDRVISTDGHPVSLIDGGADFDIWRTQNSVVDWSVSDIVAGSFLLTHQFSGAPSGTMSGMEKLIGVDPASAAPGAVQNRISRSYLSAEAPLGLHYSVFQKEVAVIQLSSGLALNLDNFNAFSGGLAGIQQPEYETSINVFATSYPLTIGEINTLIVGGNVNFGDTIQVNHTLSVSNVLKVIVSNSSSLAEQTVYYGRMSANTDRYRIVGLTPVAITGLDRVNNGSNLYPEVMLLGSKSQINRFYVSASASRTTITGGTANDVFVAGHAVGPDARNLDLLKGVVNFIGNGGSDYLRVDDRDATGRFSYRLQDNWVFNSADPSGDPVRAFQGVWHTGLSRVEIRGTAQENVFRLTPSLTVRYSVFGGAPVDPLGDRLLLLGPVPLHRQFISLGARKGTWYFGVNGSDELFVKTVYIEDIETNASYP